MAEETDQSQRTAQPSVAPDQDVARQVAEVLQNNSAVLMFANAKSLQAHLSGAIVTGNAMAAVDRGGK